MKHFDNLAAFLALHTALQAPPVTPEEALGLMKVALVEMEQHVQPLGAIELARRIVATMTPKEKPIGKPARSPKGS